MFIAKWSQSSYVLVLQTDLKALKVSHLVYLRVPNKRSLPVSSTCATREVLKRTKRDRPSSRAFSYCSIRLVSFFGLRVLRNEKPVQKTRCLFRSRNYKMRFNSCLYRSIANTCTVSYRPSRPLPVSLLPSIVQN